MPFRCVLAPVHRMPLLAQLLYQALLQFPDLLLRLSRALARIALGTQRNLA